MGGASAEGDCAQGAPPGGMDSHHRHQDDPRHRCVCVSSTPAGDARVWAVASLRAPRQGAPAAIGPTDRDLGAGATRMSAGDRWSYRSRAAPVATPTQSSYSSRRGAWAAVPRRGGAWPQHSTHALHGAWATEGYGAHCGRRYERLEARPRGRGRRGTPFSSACHRGRTAAHRGYGREFDSTPTPPPSERRTVRLEKGGGGRVAAIPNGERGGVTPTLTPWQNGRPGGRAPTGGRVRWGRGGISGGAATPPASAPCTHTMGGVPTGNHGPREGVVWQGAPRPGGTGTAPNMHQPRRS